MKENSFRQILKIRRKEKVLFIKTLGTMEKKCINIGINIETCLDFVKDKLALFPTIG